MVTHHKAAGKHSPSSSFHERSVSCNAHHHPQRFFWTPTHHRCPADPAVFREVSLHYNGNTFVQAMVEATNLLRKAVEGAGSSGQVGGGWGGGWAGSRGLRAGDEVPVDFKM